VKLAVRLLRNFPTFTTSVSRHARRVCVVHLPQADVEFFWWGNDSQWMSLNAASLVPEKGNNLTRDKMTAELSLVSQYTSEVV
jgi:hypothetical protein